MKRTKKTVKVGIISFAHMHAYSYAKQLRAISHVELCGVWDDDEERGKEAAKQFETSYHGQLEDLLSSDIEAVIICSENSRHHDHVIAAANAGKHILCEKPIATDLQDAERMIEVCQANKIIFQIAFPVRYSPAVKELHRIVETKKLGDIVAVNSTNHGQVPGGWFTQKDMSGGGAAMDHIVHVLDILRWICKDEVAEVFSELDTRFHDLEVEDCGIVLLKMESGMIVAIDPSWSRPKTFPQWGDLILEIVGTKGTLSLDIFKQSTSFYNDEDSKVENFFWGDDMDKELVEDFICTVQSEASPFITGEDGLRTLEAVKAAYRSASSGTYEKV